MAHYTLIARINAGGGKFPFVNVQFTKHLPQSWPNPDFQSNPRFDSMSAQLGNSLGAPKTVA
jgi:hypothetical protein